MLYTEFVNKAMNETIIQAENELWYLEPMWRRILFENGLSIDKISDAKKISWNDVEDVLKLEVEKRNIISSKRPAVINWFYELISTQIEPSMLQEETDYIKQVTEFMKANHEQQKEYELKEQDK